MNRAEIRKQMKDALKTRWTDKATRCPSLKTMALYIAAYLHFDCWLSTMTCNTDRHPRGVRWRVAGKGRKGTTLRVVDAKGSEILDHRAGETYRQNVHVAQKILDMEKVKSKNHYKSWPRYYAHKARGIVRIWQDMNWVEIK